MLRPVISPERALILVLIAVCILSISALVFFRRNRSAYPNKELSLVCLGTGLWLLDSIAVDRIVEPNLYLWVGRLTFFFPYFTLFWLVMFSLNFPPKNRLQTINIVTFVSFIIAAVGTYLALHPDGYVVSLGPLNEQIINHRPYFVTLLGFLSLLLLTGYIFACKWTRLRVDDKKAMRILLIGVFASALLAIIGSIINSFREDALFYQFVYPPLIIFTASLLYSFLKLGALGISVTFSRRVLLIGLLTLSLLIVLTVI